MSDIFSLLLLGLVQGISEWLPISSKTMVSIAYLKFFGGAADSLISVLIFVHLGTMLAAIIYFRQKLIELLKQLFASFRCSLETNNVHSQVKKPFTILNYLLDSPFGFYFCALLFTGIIGIPIIAIEFLFLPSLDASLLFALMGVGLLITAALLYSKKFGSKTERPANLATYKDGILTGAFQALSTIPGISRSGATTSALALLGFSPISNFELSFILSIPTMFCAEIIYWAIQLFKSGAIASVPISEGIILALSSFVFGYLTIDALIKIAARISLWQLAAAFGILMIIASASGLA